MVHNGTCRQPQYQDSGPIAYSWEFSLQLLVWCLVMLLVWTIGTYALYMDTYLNGNQTLLKRNIGMQRAILDLSIEYQKEVGDMSNVSMYANKELEKTIGKGSISYAALVAQSPHATSRLERYRQHHRSRAWWKSKRYMIPIFIVTICVAVVVTVLVMEVTKHWLHDHGVLTEPCNTDIISRLCHW